MSVVLLGFREQLKTYIGSCNPYIIGKRTAKVRNLSGGELAANVILSLRNLVDEYEEKNGKPKPVSLFISGGIKSIGRFACDLFVMCGDVTLPTEEV